METNQLVLIEEFCVHYNIDFTFIDSLQEFGLVTLIVHDNGKYLSHDDVPEVEKMIRLHYELGINLEGIDVIYNLLKQIDHLQSELEIAKTKLNFYDFDSTNLI
ncbi:MAG: chaperone modulator CbpM [Saprospiraceae bacterium]|nr:chaperone modulator CbpM [Candidatus Vicinibacter affinis]MBK9640541.1 chaperone modulator CbpM [Candidatus Vicinibacter affinis]